MTPINLETLGSIARPGNFFPAPIMSPYVITCPGMFDIQFQMRCLMIVSHQDWRNSILPVPVTSNTPVRGQRLAPIMSPYVIISDYHYHVLVIYIFEIMA